MSDIYADDSRHGLDLGLAGRVAVVTGGSRGIGRGVVHRLRRLGASVASLDVRPPVESDLDAPDIHFDCDVTEEHSVEAAMRRLNGELGNASILVNNAGVTRGFQPESLTSDQWDELMALDLKSSWLCARALLPAMRRAGRGAIVNVASVHAQATRAGVFPYAAAKSALVGFTRSLALEVICDGVRVNAICPGLVDTPAVRGRLQEDVATHLDALPMGRMGTPLEIADLVAFLASDRASFIVAAAIPIDGGVTAQLSSI